MDSEWCMGCDRHLPLDQDLYCSPECARADNCEPVASPTTPTQSTMRAWADAAPESRIERWRSTVVPGAPVHATDDERTPSPRPRRPTTATPSSSQLIPRRPKLLTQASTPVASTSLSYSSSPLPSPVLSAPITIVNSPGRTSPREHHTPPPARRPHVRPSPASSSTALTSDDSLRTPVTPVYAHRPEPAPTDAHRLSLWRQVKTWTSAKSPQASSPAFAPYRARASPLLVSDEDLLSTVEIEQCRNSFSVAPLYTEDDEPQDDGLAGWFASQMKPQQLQVQVQAPSQRSAKVSAAYAKRGRKVDRAEARYLAMAR
ncbi:hypothetical protein PENSPDRAFT_686810 [Peniophora sp. CONT]|nr:hypothetical protein PENSPDRAFT_686810 [Peniophora sp. CONT]